MISKMAINHLANTPLPTLETCPPLPAQRLRQAGLEGFILSMPAVSLSNPSNHDNVFELEINV